MRCASRPGSDGSRICEPPGLTPRGNSVLYVTITIKFRLGYFKSLTDLASPLLKLYVLTNVTNICHYYYHPYGCAVLQCSDHSLFELTKSARKYIHFCNFFPLDDIDVTCFPKELVCASHNNAENGRFEYRLLRIFRNNDLIVIALCSVIFTIHRSTRAQINYFHG